MNMVKEQLDDNKDHLNSEILEMKEAIRTHNTKQADLVKQQQRHLSDLEETVIKNGKQTKLENFADKRKSDE